MQRRSGRHPTEPLSPQQVVRRRTHRRKSTISSLLFGECWPKLPSQLPWVCTWSPGARQGQLGSPLCLLGEDDLEALKAKNIKQTELVADLREAILRVARHFQCTDPKNCSVVSEDSPA